VSSAGDTSLSGDSKNKTIFAGKIEIGAVASVYGSVAQIATGIHLVNPA
jgi:hypothetical protein